MNGASDPSFGHLPFVQRMNRSRNCDKTSPSMFFGTPDLEPAQSFEAPQMQEEKRDKGKRHDI
jgi:hypothetical protein